MMEKSPKMSQRMYDKLCRQPDFEGADENPKLLTNFRMSDSQAKRLFGRCIQFDDKESAGEYAEQLAGQGYKVYWGRKRGSDKWLVFKGK